jgi:hypothetical protein
MKDLKAWKQARKAANGALAEIGQRYWDELPTATIEATLQWVGIETTEGGLLCGRDGHTTYPLTFRGEAAPSLLSLSWHKLEQTGRYEVVVYVS